MPERSSPSGTAQRFLGPNLVLYVSKARSFWAFCFARSSISVLVIQTRFTKASATCRIFPAVNKAVWILSAVFALTAERIQMALFTAGKILQVADAFVNRFWITRTEILDLAKQKAQNDRAFETYKTRLRPRNRCAVPLGDDISGTLYQLAGLRHCHTYH